MENETLQHYGIPGMRWGQRKGSSGGTRRSILNPKGKPTYNEVKAANAKARKRDKEGGSEDAKKAYKIKKKRISEMSNEELKTLNNRLQLERQYKELKKSDMSAGSKIASNIVSTSANQVAVKYTTKAMETAGKTVINALLDLDKKN